LYHYQRQRDGNPSAIVDMTTSVALAAGSPAG